VGSDISAELLGLLRARLQGYPPNGFHGEGANNGGEVVAVGGLGLDVAPAAGEGVGGGRGADHPASKLVAQETAMLRALADLL
jgi:hypothetical protein